MIRKLITVGTSAAVIIPKEMLTSQRLHVGDSVDVQISKPSKKKQAASRSVDPEVVAWTNEFIESYRPLLKKLSKS